MSGPPPRILVAAILLAALAGLILVRAYSNPTSADCLRRYHAARNATDTARVDSVVPSTFTGNRRSCGFLRSTTMWGYAESLDDDSTAVRAVAQGIIAADNARDIATVLGYYADSAVLVPPDESPVTGYSEIRRRYESLFESYQPAIEGRIDEIVVADSSASVRGHNGGWLRAIVAGGADRSLDDVYLMTLERRGGTWLITRLSWHPASLPADR